MMSGSVTPRRSWLKGSNDDVESQWEVFLSSKREAMNRMKAGKQEALRRLEGTERTQDRSISMDFSDERDAPDSRKENPGEAVWAEERDVILSDEELLMPQKENVNHDLDIQQLIDIFTVIEKCSWDDLIQLVRLYPQAVSFPCPKNLQISSKGNWMLHEACRNNPPLQVITALLTENGDAIKAKGGKGYLPLHYACATGASTAVVERLIDAYPASVRARDTNDLMIPLHFACKWGASPEVVDLLVRSHPEGKQVRDIYAKTPMDYASELGDDRDGVMASLDRSLTLSASEVSSINLNDEASDSATKQLRRELRSIKSKVEKLSTELNERERKFALLYGAEKEKVTELEQRKEALENDCIQARMLQEDQNKKMDLLEREYKMLRSLQETHDQKRVMLEDKIKMLEQDKAKAARAIEQNGNDTKLTRDLTKALVEQERKYKSLLQAETERVQELENQAREAELTHRHYTMALLQEHEKEVSKFEELTARFKVLEGQLRREIENERNNRVSLQNELGTKGSEYQQALEDEKEKVAFLEDHITKVNDLLEAEQKRFFELESILKETLSLENEQRDEIEAEFKEKESRYQNRIEIEGKKRQQLEEAYASVAEKLKAEIEKTSGIQAYEFELKKELQADHDKIVELEKAHEESKKRLAEEREKVKRMEKAEADFERKIKAEQNKVQELESNHEKISNLLKMERESVAKLRDELTELQSVYEKEMKKVREAQQAESSARSELRSLHQRVSGLEEEEASIKTKKETDASKLKNSAKECELLKSMLESEKDRVETLTRSQEELRDLLEEEKKRVKSLESAQVIREVEVQVSEIRSTLSGNDNDEELMQAQADLDEERARVSDLEEELEILNKRLEAEKKSVQRLERNVEERDALLTVEREKFEMLLKEHADTQSELINERSKVEASQEEVLTYRALLEVEQDSVKEVQQMVDQAKVDLQSKIEELNSMEEEEKASRSALEASLKELELAHEKIEALVESLQIAEQKVVDLENFKVLFEEGKEKVIECEIILETQKHLSIADQSMIQKLEEKVEAQTSTLEIEKQRLHDLALELSETKSLLNAESRKAAELEESLSIAQKEVKTDRKKSEAIHQEQARKLVLLDSERNKVKALEHSCDQLMSLLDWEKKHVASLQDKQGELEATIEASDEELMEIKQALEKSQEAVDELTLRLITFEGMKREVIRMNAVAQQRDIMMAAMLECIGDARAIMGKASIQKAEIYVNDLQRIVGLDLAGFDYDVFNERQQKAIVSYNGAARMRTIKRVAQGVVIPLIPIGGLIAYHHHDPTLMRDISSNIADLSVGLRAGLRANLGELSSGVGQLASSVADSSGLREPVAQMVGMASRRINIRRNW